jgi:hypothetical protein
MRQNAALPGELPLERAAMNSEYARSPCNISIAFEQDSLDVIQFYLGQRLEPGLELAFCGGIASVQRLDHPLDIDWFDEVTFCSEPDRFESGSDAPIPRQNHSIHLHTGGLNEFQYGQAISVGHAEIQQHLVNRPF